MATERACEEFLIELLKEAGVIYGAQLKKTEQTGVPGLKWPACITEAVMRHRDIADADRASFSEQAYAFWLSRRRVANAERKANIKRADEALKLKLGQQTLGIEA